MPGQVWARWISAYFSALNHQIDLIFHTDHRQAHTTPPTHPHRHSHTHTHTHTHTHSLTLETWDWAQETGQSGQLEAVTFLCTRMHSHMHKHTHTRTHTHTHTHTHTYTHTHAHVSLTLEGIIRSRRAKLIARQVRHLFCAAEQATHKLLVFNQVEGNRRDGFCRSWLSPNTSNCCQDAFEETEPQTCPDIV